MTEQAAGGRDVLAELDDLGRHLLGLCGDDPLPGLESNAKDIVAHLARLKAVAQNTIELAAAYASGLTHADLVRKSMGAPDPAADQARIADLERQLAEARGSVTSG